MSDVCGISVVCPTYNSAEYIQRTIDSLLAQEEPPEEVIFSDDGSKDNTVSIIEGNRQRFIQSGIKLRVLINSHSGPGSARNRAIEIAKKSWIAFLDSDDTWNSKKLKIIKREICKFREINCIVHWQEDIRIDEERIE